MPGRFPPTLLHEVATLYYLEEATQAQIAARLGTSRPTVSRLLAEARRRGIVRIEIRPPTPDGPQDRLAEQVAGQLGLAQVFLAPTVTGGGDHGAALAPTLATALGGVGLRSGDVLLVSSGRTIYEASRSRLPHLPGVRVAPTIGGQHEPEPWYQTNEITRAVAARVGGVPAFLYAPALPGPELHSSLLREDSIRAIFDLWEHANCVVMGVGAPPATRASIPRFLPRGADGLRAAAGDVCSRFYDTLGRPVEFPGSERLVAIELDTLRRIATTIAVASGGDKVGAIAAGARGGYFRHLVTDRDTAQGLLSAAVADA